MKPSLMYDQLRYHLDVGSNFFPGALVEQHLHAAQQELVRSIVQLDPSFFVATTDLSIATGTDLYDLPQNARLGTRLIFVEKTGEQGYEYVAAQMRNYLAYHGSLINLCDTFSFVLQGNQVRVMPTPETSETIRVWYAPTYGNMVEGLIAGATTTTVTLFSGSPNYTTNYGVVSPRDDYYVGMRLEILDGVCAGEVRTVTDYVGASRTATLDSALSAIPAVTNTFAIHCPLPEDFHDLVPLRGALLGAPRNRNRQGELERLYYGNGAASQGRVDELLAWVSSRADSAVEVVGYVDHGD